MPASLELASTAVDSQLSQASVGVRVWAIKGVASEIEWGE